jgi:hypothetical protein
MSSVEDVFTSYNRMSTDFDDIQEPEAKTLLDDFNATMNHAREVIRRLAEKVAE